MSLPRRCALALACAGLLAIPGSALAADNLPPVNTVPGQQQVGVNGTLTFSAGNGNPISVSDPDAGANPIEVDLNSFNNATITLSTTHGLTFNEGTTNGAPQMNFNGTIADVNAALEGMTVTPFNNFDGEIPLQITSNDEGFTGDGGAKSDQDTISILVGENDAPANTVPVGVGTYRDQAKVLSTATSNGIFLSDGDHNNNPLQVALTVTNGTVTLSGTTGLTFTGGANGTDAMTFQGTLGNINIALSGLTFTPTAGFTGTASIAVATSDLGNTGYGGVKTDNDTALISVNAIGDMIFWSSADEVGGADPGGSIGRAALDGSGGANLVTGPGASGIPGGTAIDVVNERIYWANTSATPGPGGIFSAKLDGTDVQTFLTTTTEPAGSILSVAFGLVIDQATRRIYWANGDVSSANQGVFWASLDDPTVGGAVVSSPAPAGATLARPRGLAIDTERGLAIWTNFQGANQGISFAPLPGSSAAAGSFTVSGLATNDDFEAPNGVALDPETDRLFWANGSGPVANQRLKVADLTGVTLSGSTAIAGSTFSTTGSGGGFRTPVLDPEADRAYWLVSTTASKVSYASLSAGGAATDLSTGNANISSPDGASLLKRPEAASPPAVSGTSTTGSLLTCTAATWAADLLTAGLYRMPKSTAFSWTRNGTAIPGATSSTYTPSQAGEYRCVHTATNFVGSSVQQSETVSVSDPPPTPSGPTGQRAAALKKCKKKKGKARKKCIRRAKKLPA